MNAVTRRARRTGDAAWSNVLAAQLLVLCTARLVLARVHRADPDGDGGWTMAEYIVGLVIAIPLIIVIVTIIYNAFKSDATNSTNQINQK